MPPGESVNNVQDTPLENNSELQVGEDPIQSCTAVFCVDYETRDGSAKNGKDYHSLKGTLVSGTISKLNLPTWYFSLLRLESLASCSFVKAGLAEILPKAILA